jgi:hypothetical protein
MKRLTYIFCLCFSVALYGQTDSADPNRIQPSPEYPQYWKYQGKEILLLGGSVEDNLFQIDNLEEHLDLLVSVGGNYVRNTMSSRDEGNEWPFFRQEDGRYDLNKFNEGYWDKFEAFLRETARRGIIVQIEIWATFDFYREPWDRNPFNPKNNINYNEARSKLPVTVETHPIYTDNNFFRSVPSQMNITPVLWYQKLFVDRLLSHSLAYGHVLYCMDNETSVTSDWGKFWAIYIRKAALLAGKKVETTEMWDPHNLNHPMHYETFDNPDIFSFVDISQNNHQGGDDHWNNGIKQIEYLRKMNLLRPVNNVKVYGNDGGPHQTTRNAIESFCRNVLFGCASSRFHRPPSGQGLNDIAQKVIRSLRMLEQGSAFLAGSPDNTVLTNREDNEAYCRRLNDGGFLVYFPNGGEVGLLAESGRPYRLRWLDVLDSTWSAETPVDVHDRHLQLIAPDDRHRIARITPGH